MLRPWAGAIALGAFMAAWAHAPTPWCSWRKKASFENEGFVKLFILQTRDCDTEDRYCKNENKEYANESYMRHDDDL